MRRAAASHLHRFQVGTAAKRPRPRPRRRRTYIRHESFLRLPAALLLLRRLDPSRRTRRAFPIHHHPHKVAFLLPRHETLLVVVTATLRPARSRTRSCPPDSGSTLPLGSYPRAGSPKRHGTSLAMVNCSRTFRLRVASRSPHIIIITRGEGERTIRPLHGLTDRYRSSSRGGTPVPLQIRSSRRALPSKNVRSLDSLRPPPRPPPRRRRPTRRLLASDKERRWADPRAHQPRPTVSKQGRHPPSPSPPPPSRTTTIACCSKSSFSSLSNDVSRTDSPALEQPNHHPRRHRRGLLARVPKEEEVTAPLLRWRKKRRVWEEGSDRDGRCGSGVR